MKYYKADFIAIALMTVAVVTLYIFIALLF